MDKQADVVLLLYLTCDGCDVVGVGTPAECREAMRAEVRADGRMKGRMDGYEIRRYPSGRFGLNPFEPIHEVLERYDARGRKQKL